MTGDAASWEDGRNLLFLVSQPRAGSTMLQRVLGNSPEIHTAGETWLMLHPLYSLRESGIETEYEAGLALRALHAFHEQLPDLGETYFAAMRRMYGHLYQQATVGTGARLFLDKTPRYYFILRELGLVFPGATVIVLLRHPLAVIRSILSTWVDGAGSSLSRYAADLVEAPPRLLSFIEDESRTCLVVRYEDFVTDPSESARRICRSIGVTYQDGMVDYGAGRPWTLGDQDLAFSLGHPTPSRAEGWKEPFDDPQAWRWASDYLELLGPSLLAGLGYEYDEARAALDAVRPSRLRLLTTGSLARVLNSNTLPGRVD